MIIIKSPQEIEAMRRAGAMVGLFFEEVERHVRSGVVTRELEEFAEEFVAKHGVRGAFKGYLGYPANLCTSINEEVVHGIPSGTRGLGPKLMPGMVLAIEPMVNEGLFPVEVLPDGWTVVTRDRKRSAHFEHVVAITGAGNRT